MGHFYTNVTVKHDDAEMVARAVAEMHRYAVIAPPVDGFVMVYDLASERQDGTLFDFARRLSLDLNSIAFAVMNHDDSVLYYWLFDCGQEIDRYNSRPDYFEPSDDKQGGSASVLATALGCDGVIDELDRILHCDADSEVSDSPYVFEIDRHAELARVLRIPNWGVGYGYSYLADDQLPDGFPADDTYYTLADEDDKRSALT
jgi:hypothetical protein